MNLIVVMEICGSNLGSHVTASAQLASCGLVALTLFHAKDRCRHCCGFSPSGEEVLRVVFVLVSQANMAHLRQTEPGRGLSPPHALSLEAMSLAREPGIIVSCSL